MILKKIFSDSATSYQNGNSVTLETLNMGTEVWISSETFSEPCTVMAGTSDLHNLKSVACSETKKYACTKPLCPDGAYLFAGKSCIKLMDAATKAVAMTTCQKNGGNLLGIKNRYEQAEIERFLKQNSGNYLAKEKDL